MARNLLGLIVGLGAAIGAGFAIPADWGVWANYASVAIGSAVVGLLVTKYFWLFGAFIAALFNSFDALVINDKIHFVTDAFWRHAEGPIVQHGPFAVHFVIMLIAGAIIAEFVSRAHNS
jgi:hypothetical protein